MSATYTKLKDGSWGVRVSGKASRGAALDVTKKDGSRKSEKVRKVLWTGKDEKTGAIISLCSIAPTAHAPRMHSHDHDGMSYYDRNGNFVLGDDD